MEASNESEATNKNGNNFSNNYDFIGKFDVQIFLVAAGRWTSEEHNLFILGLQIHNKQWKNIADMVKTRTVVQIRTHAQKYFQKMEKANPSGGGFPMSKSLSENGLYNEVSELGIVRGKIGNFLCVEHCCGRRRWH